MALRVETIGDPADPAIVFLHALGVSSWMWSEQVRQLSDRFYCVTVDLPGNGASHEVPWRSFDDSAAGIAAVIAATPAGRAHVVGLSLGGYVAVALTAGHPEVVGNVVVCGVTTEPLRPAWRNRLLMRAGGAVMRQPWLTRATGAAMRLPGEARDAMAADARVLSAATTGRVHDEILPFRLPAALTPQAERVLAVAADHDVRSIREGLAAFASIGASTAVARDAHHAWNAEHPRLFSDMVEGWVTDRTVPPGLDPWVGSGSAR
ncbi:alpha/beta fold hydrolase [Plantactinospora sp. GCM10030261]|uniref:alpha/beta fold hydrolase n=1 Tax=Plantactinospora sp. GCM10030261 TaxID=3273420 RepID=UPI00360B0E0D